MTDVETVETVDTPMTIRSLRVPDELWQDAMSKAYERDEKVSEILRQALQNYTSVEDETDDGFRDVTPDERAKLAKEGAAMPDSSYPIANCEDLANAIQAIGRAKDREAVIAHIKKRAKDLDCPDVEIPESFEIDDETECAECSHSTDPETTDPEAESEDAPGVAAIWGIGRLSDSEDPETQALVTRARELILEGAVGVSIKHDMNPDDMPDQEMLQTLEEEGRFDEIDALMKEIHIRPRHLAVVDTAAFSNSRLTYNEDGTVSGPIAFEGPWTGDARFLPYGSLTWDDNLLPIPITMGHEGPGGTQPPVIGYIDQLERKDGWEPQTVVTDDEVDAVVAAAGLTSGFPAKYFEKFKASKPMPLHVDAPDANGLRRIWGHAVPRGVCHRSDMGACFQFPGDVDPAMRGFHTGASVTLDDGTSLRVGALTSGGLHIDPMLAKQGVSYREVNRHREDSNKVFAMVRAWDDGHGLAVSGVVPPDVTPSDLMRALACAPSGELWPSGSGRTLVGIHMVPTPAWPIAASINEGLSMTSTMPIEVDDIEEVVEELDLDATLIQTLSKDDLMGTLQRIEKALALLVTDKIAVGIPEVPDSE